jgi:hypothetical protein
MINFLVIIFNRNFYMKRRFGDYTLFGDRG